MDIKKLLLSLAIGVAIGFFVIPKKKDIEIKEVIKYVQVKEQKKNKKTTVIETKNPDGSVKKETTVTETTDTKTETNVSKQAEKKVKGSTSNIGLIAISEINKNILTKQPEYGIIVSKSISDSLSVNGLLTTDKKIGLGVSIGF